MRTLFAQSERGSGLQPRPLVSAEAADSDACSLWGRAGASCCGHLPALSLFCIEQFLKIKKGHMMGIQVGPGSLGKPLESEAKPTDSTLLFGIRTREPGPEDND